MTSCICASKGDCSGYSSCPSQCTCDSEKTGRAYYDQDPQVYKIQGCDRYGSTLVPCLCNKKDHCIGYCNCNTRCTCNVDERCTCDGDTYRRCSIKESSKSYSSYSWSELIYSKNTFIKPQHINEIKNALKMEAQRRAYINTDIGGGNYRDVAKTTSSFLSQLDQTLAKQYENVLMTSWKNVVSFLFGLKSNSNNCATNTTDLSSLNLLTTPNNNIYNGVRLQTLIQMINDIRSAIDNINKSCICNNKLVFPGCYSYSKCTTNRPQKCDCQLDKQNYADPCPSNYTACTCVHQKLFYHNSSNTTTLPCICFCSTDEVVSSIIYGQCAGYTYTFLRINADHSNCTNMRDYTYQYYHCHTWTAPK